MANRWLTVWFALLLPMSQSAPAADPLASYAIDPDRISISGISSGAFMANQFHIAHSESIMGAGLIAGGLYGCAAIDVTERGLTTLTATAVGACMSLPSLLQDVAAYRERIEELALRGWIDPVSGLAGDRVYLFTGASDTVVDSATVRRGAELYQALGAAEGDIVLVDHVLPPPGAGHSWVTESFGVPCPSNAPPFINDCDYDQAGAILEHIYGELAPKSDHPTGELVEFDQTEFAPASGAAANGLLDVGYLYVPGQCAAGTPARCALHVALHGCKQSAEVLGAEFARHVGLNEWADANAIVVLYPQARSVSSGAFPDPRPTDLFEINPEGCWNWFGYAYDDFYATRRGVQITAMRAMIDRIAGRGH